MLLVDDDQAEVAERREDGGPRADADAGRAGAQPPPLVEALALGEAGMEDGHAVAEARGDAADRLRGQADLGNEQDRAAAALERRLDGREVDLGLAGAGDSVKQALALAVAVERGDDLAPHRRPARGESRGAAATAPTVSIRGARRTSRVRRCDQAALGEPREDDRVGPGELADPRPGQLAVGGEALERGPLPGAEPRALAGRVERRGSVRR